MTDLEMLEAWERGTSQATISRLTGRSQSAVSARIHAARTKRQQMALDAETMPTRDELNWAVTHYGLRGAADHYGISSSTLHQWMRRRGCGSTI